MYMRSQQTQFVRLHQTNLFYSIRNRILRWMKRSVMLATVISKINLSPFKTIMMNELQIMLRILKNLRFTKKEILTLNLIQISLWQGSHFRVSVFYYDFMPQSALFYAFFMLKDKNLCRFYANSGYHKSK